MMYEIFILAAMTNEQLMDHGNRMMDDTDQAIERGKKVGLYFHLHACLYRAIVQIFAASF